MPRRNPTWRHRPRPAPCTPAEDAELAAMMRCGLSVDYYKASFPGRTFGELLDRRLTLRESGAVVPARPI